MATTGQRGQPHTQSHPAPSSCPAPSVLRPVARVRIPATETGWPAGSAPQPLPLHLPLSLSNPTRPASCACRPEVARQLGVSTHPCLERLAPFCCPAGTGHFCSNAPPRPTADRRLRPVWPAGSAPQHLPLHSHLSLSNPTQAASCAANPAAHAAPRLLANWA